MTTTAPTVARINGRPLHRPGERPDDATLRQRACQELLRQAAQDAGLLAVEDRADDEATPSAEASAAIERLLALQVPLPEPDETACRRHHAAHPRRYVRDERVELRHLLFAVTPGTDVVALRGRAEQALLALRTSDDPTLFARRAAEWSNCPSAAEGGHLGLLRAADCAPEFAREVFGHAEVGVLPRLVHSRFGLHVVEVLRREGGEPLPYDEVRSAVRLSLQQHAWATALHQYLQRLATAARLEGVPLDHLSGDPTGDGNPLQR